MKSILENRGEKILTYLDLSSYNPSVIQRSAKLAEVFGCPFHVWFSRSAAEETYSGDQLDFALCESKKMSVYFGAESFMLSKVNTGREFLSAFEAVQNELHITQLVLTGAIESRWDELLYGSTVNYLMKKYSDLELHFVSQNAAFPYKQWAYKKGRKAFLIEDKEGFILSYRASKGIIGVFFKKKATDFESGIFITLSGDEIKTFTIVGGNVVNLQPESYKVLKPAGNFNIDR